MNWGPVYPSWWMYAAAGASLLLIYLVVQTIRHETRQFHRLRDPLPDREQRRRLLNENAPGLGMEFFDERDHDHAADFAQFSVFQRGYFQYRYHTLYDARQFDAPSGYLFAGDYSYKQDLQVMLEMAIKTFEFSYLILALERAESPLITIRRREAPEVFEHPKRPTTLDFKYDAFGDRFLVRASDEEAARPQFSSALKGFLEQIHDRLGPLEIAIHGDSICISDGQTIWEPNRFGEVADWAETLAKLLTED